MSRLVLCLGMHRSGTSAVTAGLPCLGVSLGTKLMGPAPDNPKGFWEDYELMPISDWALGLVGAAWDSLERPASDEMHQLHASDLGDHARNLLAWRLRDTNIFGFKDPRLCRVLPFWKPIFAELDCAVSYIRVTRDRSSVIASLMRRNGMSQEHATALCETYEQECDAGVDPSWPHACVKYETLLQSPFAVLAGVARVLDLPFDASLAEAYSHRFISPSLNHGVA